MKYFDKSVYLLVFYFFSTSSVFAQAARNLALKLRGNVVHLHASFEEQTSKNGFGFVIGEKKDTLYITTAWHVVMDKNSVENNKPKELKIKFYQFDRTFQGKVLRHDPKKDVAVISVEKPDEYEWKKNCVDKHPKEGGKAYYIGKVDEWRAPTEAVAGGIRKIDDLENIITAENLNIAPGSSGGPLLSSKGIIGMIRTDERDPMGEGLAMAVGLKTIKNIATKGGQYPYVYSLPPSKLPKSLMISGLGVLGATGIILGVRQIHEAKTSEEYDYYKNHTNPKSTVDYPYNGSNRQELYDDANDKYVAGQALVVGGSIALGAAAWLLIKERVVKPKNKSLSKLSITPQVYWGNVHNSMGAKGIHVVYAF
jgi:hypothetical protein